MLPGSLYWLAICAVIGAAVYALLCQLDPADDPFSDAADWEGATLPTDFETLFHSRKD